MNKKKDGSKKGMIVGSVLGGVLGAVTALLVTPKSGKELRKDINHQLVAAKDKTIDAKDTAKGKANEVATLVKDKSSTISQSILKQGEKLSSKAQGLIRKARKKDHVTFDDLKDVTKDIMKEEIESGKEIRELVKEEMKDVQGKVSNDMKKFRRQIRKEVKGTVNS
jgi:gas vesicle protein